MLIVLWSPEEFQDLARVERRPSEPHLGCREDVVEDELEGLWRKVVVGEEELVIGLGRTIVASSCTCNSRERTKRAQITGNAS